MNLYTSHSYITSFGNKTINCGIGNFLEPGYYEKDQFGIRIEDIVQIIPAQVPNNFNGRGALTFKTVTMCPIHTKLINKTLLTEKEVNI